MTERLFVDRLVESAREARAEGLVVSSSGNFSVRIDAERFAISRARARLGRLRREDVLVLTVNGSVPRRRRSRPGTGRPSRETPMHRALYRALPGAGSILHFQSPAATLLACSSEPTPDLNFIPEFSVYVRRAGSVPFLPPGSEELGEAVVEQFELADVRVVQLGNHGQVVVGDDPEQAVERAAFFEFACRLYVRSRGKLRRYTSGELDILKSC